MGEICDQPKAIILICTLVHVYAIESRNVKLPHHLPPGYILFGPETWVNL